MKKAESEIILGDTLGRQVTFYTRGGSSGFKLVDYQGVVMGVTENKILVRIGKSKRNRLFVLDEIRGLKCVNRFV